MQRPLQRLAGQHVVVGVAGSIAAYRAADVVRALRAHGASVRVAPTKAAQAFVTPLLFEALSGQPCLLTSLDVDQGKIPHVEEAYAAAVVVVVPASADLLAKMAHGFADEAILSLLLSFAGPVVVAPAMESHMWTHPATQANVTALQSRGVVVVGPVAGPLASGRSGQGRMVDVDVVVEAAISAATTKDLAGRRVVVTAGPTVEDLDPVRSVTNRSSGKMGTLVARELALRGAAVTLVHGPMNAPPSPMTSSLLGLTLVPVRSAKEMADAVFAHLNAGKNVDAAVLAAAVADFTPSVVAPQKIKKTAETTSLTLTLTTTTDILSTIGNGPLRPPVLVGFAAETNDVEENAQKKRQRKNCTFVVANDVVAAGSGFDVDTNRVYFAHSEGSDPPSRWLPQTSKEEAARAIVDELKQALERT